MYVTVAVFHGARALLPWTMHLGTVEHTFVQLLEEVRVMLVAASLGLETRLVTELTVYMPSLI